MVIVKGDSEPEAVQDLQQISKDYIEETNV